MTKCPGCKKEFADVFTVPTNSMEPFTSVDVMKGVQAYGIFSVEKALLCHVGAYVHFAFLKVAEVQPADTPPGMVYMVPGEERLVKMERFDQQALADAHRHHNEHPQTCDHEGCQALGIPCYYDWTNEVPDGWYCHEHAHDAGFCPGCGLFNAGFESFDFSKTGYCESCQEEIESEFDDDLDDEVDDYDDDEFYADSVS